MFILRFTINPTALQYAGLFFTDCVVLFLVKSSVCYITPWFSEDTIWNYCLGNN